MDKKDKKESEIMKDEIYLHVAVYLTTICSSFMMLHYW